MSQFSKSPLAMALASSLALTGCGSDSSSSSNKTMTPGNTVTLRIMETTDIHANILNHDYYKNQQDDGIGLVKTATLVEQARTEVDNSVLVDNGDLLQGSPLGQYFAKVKTLENGEVHPIYKAMNILQYDAANIGNHEFNFGLDFLKEAIDDAEFPYISANVFIDDGDDIEENDVPFVKPYVIKSKIVLDSDGEGHRINIGYIGFVPPQIMNWDKANLEGQLIAKDIVDMANHYVPQMKNEGADIIIAIPHSGLKAVDREGGEENATYYLSQVEGIDAILFGHAHQNFPGAAEYDDMEGVDNVKGTINGVPAVMPGFWGNHLGVIDLTLEYSETSGWEILDSQSELRAISVKEGWTSVSLVESHAEIQEAVITDHDEVNEWVSEPFAKISAPINSFFALTQDDPSIQVVTDAQKWAAPSTLGDLEAGLPILSVGAPFRAGRGGVDDYTNLSAGDVSLGGAADLYIFPNTMKIVKITGAEVKEWLEMSAGQFNRIQPGVEGQALINLDFPTFNFDVIDGVSYEIDVTQPAKYTKDGDLVNAANSRIVNLRFENAPIDVAQEFLVVTNNYRASGGGNFPGITEEKIVVDAPDANRDVLVRYLTAQTEANPETGFDPSADGNWRISNVNDTTVVVRGSISPTAQAFANAQENLTYVGEGANEDNIDEGKIKIEDEGLIGYGVYLMNLDHGVDL